MPPNQGIQRMLPHNRCTAHKEVEPSWQASLHNFQANGRKLINRYFSTLIS